MGDRSSTLWIKESNFWESIETNKGGDMEINDEDGKCGGVEIKNMNLLPLASEGVKIIQEMEGDYIKEGGREREENYEKEEANLERNLKKASDNFKMDAFTSRTFKDDLGAGFKVSTLGLDKN